MSDQPFITKHFKNNKPSGSTSLNLSLFIDNESFMFAVFSKDFSELIELCDVRNNETIHNGNNHERILFLLNNYQLPAKKFETVNVSILNSQFSILPEAFALKETSKEILQFSSGQQPKTTYTHQFNNLSFNYFIDNDVIQVLERSFKNASFRHAGAVSVNLLFNNRSLKKCDVFLNFNEGIFELLAKNENNLLYYNVFNYDGKEDVLYYLLFMMEQFNLSPEKARLIIAGQIDVESDLYKELKKYIKNIGFAINTISLKNSGDLKIPDHFYFTLLNQHLCEL